ncbi:MAG: hypothetical protein WCS70_02935 [Verrucomicrobiota bacterium]
MIPTALAGIAVAAAMTILPPTVGAQNASSVSTFRETVATPHIKVIDGGGAPKPRGTVTLQKQGAKQIFAVDVRNLIPSTGWGVWLDPNPTFQQGDVLSLLCQLDRVVSTGNTYRTKLEAWNTAPQFLTVSVSDLNDLTNQAICIGAPLVAGATNTTIDCILWAPISELLPDPNQVSFKKRAKLTLPVPPVITGQLWTPALKARGKISLQQSGTTGQSSIQVDAKNLLGGHTYSVWMTLTTVLDPEYPACITNSAASCLVKLDELTPDVSGKGGWYIRDTAAGDSLPEQVRYASDLANRLLMIKDEADLIYLQGVIPGP